MARALWSGSLSFGLVNVPVNLVPAIRDLDLHFHQVHHPDGAPIDVERWCSEEDVEVGPDEISRSYEFEDGRRVIVTDAELEAIEPRRTRTIDIEQFVDLAEIDPIYFDHPYFLVPASADDGAARAYRLLADVMAAHDRAAVGRFVLRTKEYLVVVRPRDGALTLTTMLFADEVRPADDVDVAADRRHKPTAKQLAAATAVIEELSTDWNPGAYEDRYRARLEEVVQRKRQGQTITAPAAAEPPQPAPDLLAALEQTLSDMRGGARATAQ